MARSIEIRLALAVVTPLLQLLREFVASDAVVGKSGDASRLLDLFHPDFEHTGTIRVDASESSTVLRGCALIRLRIRSERLSHLPDATIETSADAEGYSGDEKKTVLLYWFVATLQTIVLEKLPPEICAVSSVERARRLLQQLVRRFRGQAAETKDHAVAGVAEARVVVGNDPVNLMAYVTAVFRAVFDMPQEVASRHMREIHEQKSSVVWSGPREKAENYVKILRAWHLTTTLELIDHK